MKIIRIFPLILFLGSGTGVLSQNPYIKHYTTQNGLPSNTIYQIYQDSHKFIWFTSDAGVVRFDGSNFTSYRKKDGLSSNDVVRMKEDPQGRIWFFSYNANVNYFYNNKIYNGENAPFLKKMTGKGFILDFLVDTFKNNKIYFYNWQQEVFTLDNKNTVKRDLLFKNVNIDLPLVGRSYERIKVFCLEKSPKDDWIIWTNTGTYLQHDFQDGLTIVDTSMSYRGIFPTSDSVKYAFTLRDGLIKVSGITHKVKIQYPGETAKIRTILEDSEGYIWVSAYDEGVFCLKENSVIMHFDIPDALGLLQDNEKNIWISTQSDGIYVIHHDLLIQKHFNRGYFEDYGLNQLCDHPGFGIWCTTSKAVFLLKKDILYKLSVPKSLQPVNIIHLFNNQSIILGALGSRLGIFRNMKPITATKTVVTSQNVKYLCQAKKIITDRTGSLTTSFDQNQIRIYNSDDATLNTNLIETNERINNIYYNNRNDLVINSSRNYLYRNNKLLPYPVLSGFDGTVITDHLLLTDSVELLNIDGDSLFLLRNQRFYNLTDAFNTPITLQIITVFYAGSTLYLATLKDIYVCRNPMNVLLGHPIHLEPLNISFNNINDILIHNDSLYVASDDGLTILAEESIAKSIAIPPIPYLQSITVNDKAYPLTDEGLKLKGKNNIHLSFACISYFSTSVIYSYKLEGAEYKWTNGTGSSINLVYQNLPSGRYTFKLRVRKSNSDWSKPLELPVYIQPTILEYPAFWAIVILLISLVIFLIVNRLRTEKMKKIEVDHNLVLMEQKALQSMMNPHFIFNSLGSIQSYLLKNKGSDAVVYLSNFARLIRKNLNAINTPMIQLEEEIERLRNYLDLEQERLENKFEYYIEFEDAFEEYGVYIPSMIIQPFAENSIWHGIATIEEKGVIRIFFQAFSPTSLKIIVEDNGIGIKKSMEYADKGTHHQRLGIQLIKKRLELLGKKFKTETSIDFSEFKPGHENPGTHVVLIVPFLTKISDL